MDASLAVVHDRTGHHLVRIGRRSGVDHRGNAINKVEGDGSISVSSDEEFVGLRGEYLFPRRKSASDTIHSPADDAVEEYGAIENRDEVLIRRCTPPAATLVWGEPADLHVDHGGPTGASLGIAAAAGDIDTAGELSWRHKRRAQTPVHAPWQCGEGVLELLQ